MNNNAANVLFDRRAIIEIMSSLLSYSNDDPYHHEDVTRAPLEKKKIRNPMWAEHP